MTSRSRQGEKSPYFPHNSPGGRSKFFDLETPEIESIGGKLLRRRLISVSPKKNQSFDDETNGSQERLEGSGLASGDDALGSLGGLTKNKGKAEILLGDDDASDSSYLTARPSTASVGQTSTLSFEQTTLRVSPSQLEDDSSRNQISNSNELLDETKGVFNSQQTQFLRGHSPDEMKYKPISDAEERRLKKKYGENFDLAEFTKFLMATKPRRHGIDMEHAIQNIRDRGSWDARVPEAAGDELEGCQLPRPLSPPIPSTNLDDAGSPGQKKRRKSKKRARRMSGEAQESRSNDAPAASGLTAPEPGDSLEVLVENGGTVQGKKKRKRQPRRGRSKSPTGDVSAVTLSSEPTVEITRTGSPEVELAPDPDTPTKRPRKKKTKKATSKEQDSTIGVEVKFASSCENREEAPRPVENFLTAPLPQVSAQSESGTASDLPKTPRKRRPKGHGTEDDVFHGTPGGTPAPTPKRTPAGTSIIVPPPLNAPIFGLIQEEFKDRPYLLLVAVVFLQKTKGSAAIPIFRSFVEKWATPEALINNATEAEVSDMFQTLGLQNTRAKTVWRLASSFVTANPYNKPPGPMGWTIRADYKPTDPDGLHRRWGSIIGDLYGMGKYAIDSWRIFAMKPGQGGFIDGTSTLPRRKKEDPSPAEESEVVPADDDGVCIDTPAKIQPEPCDDVAPPMVTYLKDFTPGDEEWRRVPTDDPKLDKELKAYVKWMHAKDVAGFGTMGAVVPN